MLALATGTDVLTKAMRYTFALGCARARLTAIAINAPAMEIATPHSIPSTPLGLLGAEHQHYAITPAQAGVRNLTATIEGTVSQTPGGGGMADARSAAKRPPQLHRCGTNPNVGSGSSASFARRRQGGCFTSSSGNLTRQSAE